MASQNLKSFLSTAQVSVESLDMSDGEQKLEVQDESKAELHEANAEMAEAEGEYEAVDRDCEELVEAQSALERYYTAMERSLDDGGLSAQSAEMMAIGLERYEELLGLDDKLVPSAEAFGGSAPRTTTTRVSMEAVGDVVKKAWDMVKRALQALKDMLVKLQRQYRESTTKLEARVKKVQDEISKNGGTPTKEVLTLKSPQKLSVDGTYEPDSIDLIRSLLSFVSNDQAKSIEKFGDELIKAVNNIDPAKGDVEAQVKQHFPKADASLAKRFGGTEITVDAKGKHKGYAKRSTILPGNMALYLTWAEEGNHRVEDIHFNMAPVPEAKSAPESVQIEVSSLDNLSTRLSKINRIIKFLKDDGGERYDALVKRMVQAGDDLQKRTDAVGEELSTEDRNWVAFACRNLLVVQQVAGRPVADLKGYTIRTLTAALAVIEFEYRQGYAGQSSSNGQVAGNLPAPS